MDQETFVRARRPEQKQQRREAILAAAGELALERGVRNVSLGDIAKRVGFAKSNVVRYFGTREEIYLELSLVHGRQWVDEVKRRLPCEGIVDALVEPLGERPLLCDLISQGGTSLEHNVGVEAAAEFKRTMHGLIVELAVAIAECSAELTEAEASEVVTAAAACAMAFYPAANPPPTLREAYDRHPELAAMQVEFVPATKRAVAALLAGIPTLR
ncbi:transcriptional regulator, TetR family [Prauserella aidingensis]|uniref:TetR/AcrR family transcriptional regulator n=1 Tax=Prauserella aidingensis TaxID=387890 RepID=UPI0020A2665F|nr:TetR/AcrR family transcriptional regulator [Prauserella aidingensis]MCP2253202.1 transcriptional regulator, TetR family [Prauserella aidingensis]